MDFQLSEVTNVDKTIRGLEESPLVFDPSEEQQVSHCVLLTVIFQAKPVMHGTIGLTNYARLERGGQSP